MNTEVHQTEKLSKRGQTPKCTVICKQDKDRSDLKWGEEKGSLETEQIQKSIRNGINTEVHETQGKHRRVSKSGQTQKCTEIREMEKMHQN